ncbi:hypothetical protein F5Y08DRAFT_68960 [Xylaria arbuscula]|nr:hypothetical protein F5Y08DRAFT_68960 [Xylaria arbuscula]
MRREPRFEKFMLLPKKIRDRIWKIHNSNRRVRHYFSQVPTKHTYPRYYAAIDMESNRMLQNALGPRDRLAFWDKDATPVMGESDAMILLRGRTWSPYLRDYRSAMSIVTTFGTRNQRLYMYSLTRRRYIHMNYAVDMVVLDGLHSCFQPLFKLGQSRVVWRDLQNTWLWNVQHLALGIDGCRENIEKSIAALPAIKHVYLLVHRDPQCPHGAPREWWNFEEKYMNEHKFMHIRDFVTLHPCQKKNPCECETKLFRAINVKHDFQRAFLAEYKLDVVKIAVVADPY